ncbi:MAG: hypothetical protein EXX96DRAFT_622770 [Benjaminiella poitrasii]|nr:MAG: hypothetical protein EXX96DRAFT_622770 [Benjaminiella poitrasii]
MIFFSLPLEIFQVIASHFTNEDISTCQNVCSLWYKTWVVYRYNNVHTKDEKQFHTFFHNNLEKSLYDQEEVYSIGYQVRKLVIEKGRIEPTMLGRLPLLCPHLEVFVHEGVVLSEAARQESFHYYQQRQKSRELDKVKHNFMLWENMRHLVELNGITIACTLLQQPTSLTLLSIQFNNQNDLTNQKPLLINLLHHAAQLTTLTLVGVYLSITDLEKIHKSSPQLINLNLLDTVLMVTKLSCSIEPATSLREFHLVNGSMCDDILGCVDYISRKYTHLKILEIENYVLSTNQYQRQEHDLSKTQIHSYSDTKGNGILKIARQCKKLEVLKLQSFVLNDIFFRILDRNGIHLTHLALGDNSYNENLVYELNALIQSDQRHYIKQLEINCWSLVKEIYGLELLMFSLSQCRNLTSLRLCLGRNFHPKFSASIIGNDYQEEICLESILKYCSNLTSLVIAHAKLILPAHDSYVTTTKNTKYILQTLKLENILVNDNISSFISAYCKSLQHLSFIAVAPGLLYESCNHAVDVYLPFHHLHTLVLDRVRVSRKCSTRLGASRFKITLGDSRETTWYDLTKYKCSNNNTLRSSREIQED